MEKENYLKLWSYQIKTSDGYLFIQGIISADSWTKAKIEANRIKEELQYKIAKSCPNVIDTGMYFLTKVDKYDENGKQVKENF